jgi:hypothetical protein
MSSARNLSSGFSLFDQSTDIAPFRSQGKCAVSEIVVAERSPDPPLLVMMSKTTVVAADSIAGLRTWSLKHDRKLLATTPLSLPDTDTLRLPISMALDSSNIYAVCERTAIGFADGSFSVYALKTDEHRFECLYTHPTSSNGALAAIAYSSVSSYFQAAC